jgi:SsrA-binding protein
VPWARVLRFVGLGRRLRGGRCFIVATPMADIVTNSKARRNYHILETFEAGIVLHGTEVKSLRAGKGQLAEAFARVDDGEVFLHNAHIDEYAQGNRQNHKPKAPRKLLLHRSEIRKLEAFTEVKGNALVPLSLYWKNGRVKVTLAVGHGKQEFDKREDLKRRESDRELKQITMHRLKAR